ncbi:hypothetical protein [Microbacterium sp.]|uniref:hypothetical protein n=1 Tax=Microbacterium sp. TaxID=51671 RepID=UPI00262D34BE|nr:hypothetical protein [Microbacterium sp.]
MRRASRRAAAAVAALVVTAPLLVNAAPSPRHTGLCDSFLSFLCPDDAKDDPLPEETTAPTEDTADASTPDAPDDEADTDEDTSPDDGGEEEPVPAPVDDGAPIFTGTPAAMGAGGLSFTGLRGISIVSVPTVDGDTVRVLKISAESITITDFSLTVRPPDEPGLVTDADTMSLRGNVSVYLGSASASALGGEPLTLGLDTPPSLAEIEPGLIDVSFGLIGSIADEIVYTNTDQRIVEE